MVSYRLSPYLEIIENRLTKGVIQFGLFHRLSGQIVEVTYDLQMVLNTLERHGQLTLSTHELQKQGGAAIALLRLIEQRFLVPIDEDPFVHFIDHYVVRPLQNPAVGYESAVDQIAVVRTNLSEYVLGRKKDELPELVEEVLPTLPAEIFANADGTKTLREIFAQVNLNPVTSDAKEAVDFLTSLDRQLIKFTSHNKDLNNPFKPCNINGRNLRHADDTEPKDSVTEFHLKGIEDGQWEFDQLELTLNHAFRFPSEVFKGLNYGARFCRSTLDWCTLPGNKTIEILEVGGGTGTFARSFLEELARCDVNFEYHILDLSPVLIEHQKSVLSDLNVPITHFHQDATRLNLPDKSFDLIVSNEVIADFPVSEVQRSEGALVGSGSYWVERYGLESPNNTNSFLVNSGVFQFLEHAWAHLRPEGALILTEYGAENTYPVQAFQLNHEEFSIHFGQVMRCATQIGFECRLVPLKEFLAVDDQVLIFDGHEERILCLNQILFRYGLPAMPYAAWSRNEFESTYGQIIQELKLIGLSFSPLREGFHFTPDFDAFMALIIRRPKNASTHN